MQRPICMHCQLFPNLTSDLLRDKPAYKPLCVHQQCNHIHHKLWFAGWLISDAKLGKRWRCMHTSHCILLFVMYSCYKTSSLRTIFDWCNIINVYNKHSGVIIQ